ncbi:MAG TPA: DUF58 domain-containing protein [Frankiaceae bacterium]|nr:DUF58 domain-containing protein [Frankiaceae bacterium]
MRLTRAGKGALAAAALLYAVAVVLGYEVLRLLGGACLGAVVAAYAHVWRRTALWVGRTVFPDRVPRGDPALAELTVRNDGRHRSAPFTAFDVVAEHREPVEVATLQAGEETTRTYPVPTSRRGVLRIGPLVLTRQDALGLVRAEIRSGSRAEIWVLPRTYPVVPVRAGRARQYEGASVDDTVRGTQVFHALREYTRGDDFRTIHWRTSARVGQLMVRDHIDPHTPDVTVLLDNTAGALGPERFEEAVDFAASLLCAALDSSHPARLVTADGVSSSVTAGAFDGSSLIDRLTLVEQVARGDVLAHLDRGATGSCLVLVGGAIPEQSLLRLARMRPRFRFVAAADFGDAEPVASPILVIRAGTAAQAARDWNAAMT